MKCLNFCSQLASENKSASPAELQGDLAVWYELAGPGGGERLEYLVKSTDYYPTKWSFADSNPIHSYLVNTSIVPGIVQGTEGKTRLIPYRKLRGTWGPIIISSSVFGDGKL